MSKNGTHTEQHRVTADRTLWIIAVGLMLFSLLPIYSSSSGIAYARYLGSPLNMLIKHVMLAFSGLAIIYLIQAKVSYRWLGGLSKVVLPIGIVLLIYTLLNGHTSGDATRWVYIPFTTITFQSSALVAVILIVYLARTLAITDENKLKSFGRSFSALLLPIILVCVFILPANFSTAALVFVTSCLVLFVGGYPLINIGKLLGMGFIALSFFVLVSLAFPQIDSRVSTWKSRVESFFSAEKEDNYQTHKAKIAIAQGGLLGKGPGKSVQKNFLPQANSDFIYAIIVEEFGLIGAFIILGFYLLFFIRILAIASAAHTRFGSILVFGLGLNLMMQAFINMGVAVNVFPVTGQTLPLISSGGTSIWVNSLTIGIILSVSRENNKLKEAHNHEEPEDSEFAETINLHEA